jgi:hypothetical protein
MKYDSYQSTMREICALAERAACETPSDGQLLDNFAARCDERSFAALMQRHGPMVYGTATKPVKGNGRIFRDFLRADERAHGEDE